MATVYTDVGEAQVTDFTQASGNLDSSGAWVGWGTGGGTAIKADTTLFTEASESRVNPTTTDQPSADIARWIATITADGTKTITNAGIFDASTSGNLFVKGDFGGIALVLNDKIEFTITLEQT